jgi:replication fork protection complex subunit Tof1/Swi1
VVVAAEELAWYIPASVIPEDLKTSLTVIEQYLEKPIDLSGKKASQMLAAVRKRRRRSRSKGSGSEAELSDEEEAEKKKRKERKRKEQANYKSAELIEDSDEEFDEDAFYAKERARRELNESLAKQGLPVAMKATGTKKRKEKKGPTNERKRKSGGEGGKGARKKARASSEAEEEIVPITTTQEPIQLSDDDADVVVTYSPKPSQPRPRAKVLPTASSEGSVSSPAPDTQDEEVIEVREQATSPPLSTFSQVVDSDSDDDIGGTRRTSGLALHGFKKKGRAIFSDDDD